MTRAYDYTTASVVTIIAIVMHYIMIEMVAPGTGIWDLATTGTEVLNGQARAGQWFEIIVLWVPLIGIAGVWAWAFVREWRRQVQTAAPRAR